MMATGPYIRTSRTVCRRPFAAVEDKFWILRVPLDLELVMHVGSVPQPYHLGMSKGAAIDSSHRFARIQVPLEPFHQTVAAVWLCRKILKMVVPVAQSSPKRSLSEGSQPNLRTPFAPASKPFMEHG